MISSTFIALYFFAMPVFGGLILFGLSMARGHVIAPARWEIVTGASLAVMLVAAASMLMVPRGLTEHVAAFKRRAQTASTDRTEAVSDARTIASYEALLRTPANPFWARRWDFFAMDEPFPLEPIDPKRAAAFVAERIANHDDWLRQQGWRNVPRSADHHCEIRQWDARSGNWDAPLAVWFVRLPAVGTHESGRSFYTGFAVLRGGHPARLVDHVNDAEYVENNTRLLNSLFYNRLGSEWAAVPIGEAAERRPSLPDEESFQMTADAPISVAGNAAHRRATLKALPDGSYELVRRLHRSVERHVVRLENPNDSWLRSLLDDPLDRSDDDGFPVTVHFNPEGPKQALRFAVSVAKDRQLYRWRTDHPDHPAIAHFMIRNAGVERDESNGKADPDGVTRSLLRWRYDTTFSEVPVLHGSVRCKGRPPGEMKAVMALGEPRR